MNSIILSIIWKALYPFCLHLQVGVWCAFLILQGNICPPNISANFCRVSWSVISIVQANSFFLPIPFDQTPKLPSPSNIPARKINLDVTGRLSYEFFGVLFDTFKLLSR